LEGRDALERFFKGNELADEAHEVGPRFGRRAAMVVAVLAGFLAVSTLLSNEAIKEVVTGETRRAETSAKLESNLLKTDVASGNSVLLRTLAAGGPHEARAAAAARLHEGRIERELAPTDRRLNGELVADEQEVSDANTGHLEYELSAVGLQVGIVLASVSIIARRRWLLAAAGASGTAGVVLLLVGLLG
jgi:hypothetical protein